MSAEAFDPTASVTATNVLPGNFGGDMVAPAAEAVPAFILIDGGVPDHVETSRDSSTQLHEWYFQARAMAGEVEKPEGEELTEIQSQVAAWLNTEGPLKGGYIPSAQEYAGEGEKPAGDKIASLIEYLRHHVGGAVSDIELQATGLFLTSTEAMYESTPQDGSVHPDADGSFAFVVPARMSRHNTEYGQEVEKVMPALRYVPNELRAQLLVGLPPFVIDRYKPTDDGKRGYLVLAPVFPDMTEDLGSAGDSLKTAVSQVNKAVDFAYGRFGAEVVGLGATLPSYTRFGQKIDNPNVITTTGHGGTIHLIFKTLERAVDEGRVSEETVRRIGVLGLGAIGGAIARVARDEYPEAKMTVYDKDKVKLTADVAKEIEATAAEDEAQVIRESDIIISAIGNTRLHLAEMGLRPEDLEGKLIIDDSQPAVFDPEEVKAFGATLAWVVGEDGDHIVRGDYTYGDTLAGLRALFGCEAEAASIAKLKQELLASGKDRAEVDAEVRRVAIRTAVTPAMVRAIGNLFDKNEIGAAPLQALGQLV